jgi:hypothetical protein
LTSGHLLQDLAHFRGGVLNRPANLAITDVWITSLVELKSQRGIGCWTDNVFGLLHIRQRMRVCARSRKSRGASGGGCSRVADLTCGGKRPECQGAQPGRALSPTGKHPYAFNRFTRLGI